MAVGMTVPALLLSALEKPLNCCKTEHAVLFCSTHCIILSHNCIPGWISSTVRVHGGKIFLSLMKFVWIHKGYDLLLQQHRQGLVHFDMQIFQCSSAKN